MLSLSLSSPLFFLFPSPSLSLPTAVTCPQPTGFIKVKIIGKTCIGNAKPGCFMMFSCEDNFLLMQGSLVRRCMENGQWQGEAPKCGRKY